MVEQAPSRRRRDLQIQEVPPAPNSDALAAALEGPFYDLEKYVQPRKAKWTHHCPRYPQYTTASKKFCPHRNLIVPAEDLCTVKCKADFNAILPNGKPDYCDGHIADAPLSEHYAICLPRERCEALCDSLEHCSSIDMHRVLPRCFLNTAECEDEGVELDDTHWEYEYLTRSFERTAYRTHTYHSCTEEDALEDLGPLTREACEAACTARADYAGFTLFQVRGDRTAGRSVGDEPQTCILAHEGCDLPAVLPPAEIPHVWCVGKNETDNLTYRYRINATQKYTNVTVNFTRNVSERGFSAALNRTISSWYLEKYDGMGLGPMPLGPGRIDAWNELMVWWNETCYSTKLNHRFVRKIAAKPCEVEVKDLGLPRFSGRYVAPTNADDEKEFFKFDERFRAFDNVSRIVWDGDQRCRSWVLEESDDVVTVPLSNCSDSPAAAITFTAHAKAEYPERFVCELLAERRKCKSPVVRALCAFSCTPFTHTRVGFEVIASQTSGTCRGDDEGAAQAFSQRVNNSGGVLIRGERGDCAALVELCQHDVIGVIVTTICKATCGAPVAPLVEFTYASASGRWLPVARTEAHDGPLVAQAGPCQPDFFGPGLPNTKRVFPTAF